jgi:hypothetical protein
MIRGNGFDEKKSRNAAIFQFLMSLPEIDSPKEKGELLLCDLCRFRTVHRPGELVFLQALQPLCGVARYVKNTGERTGEGPESEPLQREYFT